MKHFERSLLRFRLPAAVTIFVLGLSGCSAEDLPKVVSDSSYNILDIASEAVAMFDDTYDCNVPLSVELDDLSTVQGVMNPDDAPSFTAGTGADGVITIEESMHNISDIKYRSDLLSYVGAHESSHACHEEPALYNHPIELGYITILGSRALQGIGITEEGERLQYTYIDEGVAHLLASDLYEYPQRDSTYERIASHITNNLGARLDLQYIQDLQEANDLIGFIAYFLNSEQDLLTAEQIDEVLQQFNDIAKGRV